MSRWSNHDITIIYHWRLGKYFVLFLFSRKGGTILTALEVTKSDKTSLSLPFCNILPSCELIPLLKLFKSLIMYFYLTCTKVQGAIVVTERWALTWAWALTSHFEVLHPSFFYAREGTLGGILNSHRPSVTNRVSAISHKLLKQI